MVLWQELELLLPGGEQSHPKLQPCPCPGQQTNKYFQAKDMVGTHRRCVVVLDKKPHEFKDSSFVGIKDLRTCWRKNDPIAMITCFRTQLRGEPAYFLYFCICISRFCIS